MNYYCSHDNMTLETDSSIIYHQYFNCQMILITDFRGYVMREREKKIKTKSYYFLGNTSNREILEHKYNQDDKSIKIQCFSNGNGLSA